MLSYEILDRFVFVLVWFDCWVHIMILCFLVFAICALCHRSCFHARVVGGHISMTLFYFRYSDFDHCLLSFLCLSLDLRAILVLTLFCIFRKKKILLPSWLMSSALLSQVLIADRGVIVCCPLRKCLRCLNWLVYLALPGEVSIAGHGVIVYCLLRKSPAAFIGWCIWHFWVKCQFDDHKCD